MMLTHYFIFRKKASRERMLSVVFLQISRKAPLMLGQELPSALWILEKDNQAVF
jgi:hypothetical protein